MAGAAGLLPDEIRAGLVRAGLCAPDSPARELDGGVSSDIWLVGDGAEAVCVKRARARLKVRADWRVPTGRSASEIAWLETVAAILPEAVPPVLVADAEAGWFAMTYLPAATHPVWKTELAAGRVDPDVAARVGDALGRIHAATATDPALPERFANDALFDALRLDPYLGATAAVHPDLADSINSIRSLTATTRVALIHGDVSPKNILVGPAGPVFLDAECATWGDPAFDLAFVLNHLLLKTLWVPAATLALLASFDALRAAYLVHLDWEPPSSLETRTVALLPALLLARVDGKSPVEYLEDRPAAQDLVRRFARARLASSPTDLTTLGNDWRGSLP